MCENAKLKPTPAKYQMDFVCNGKLTLPPQMENPADGVPQGCGFYCRDKLPAEMCEGQAKLGACESHAKTMRFQCASTCGVCKGIGMASVPHDALPRPRCGAKEEKVECRGWAEIGECVKNFDYMKSNCELACGFCAADGQAPLPMEIALRTTLPSSRRGGKKEAKKKMKATNMATSSATLSAAETNVAGVQGEAAGGLQQELNKNLELAAKEELVLMDTSVPGGPA